jgi:hypothetical protein
MRPAEATLLKAGARIILSVGRGQHPCPLRPRNIASPPTMFHVEHLLPGIQSANPIHVLHRKTSLWKDGASFPESRIVSMQLCGL